MTIRAEILSDRSCFLGEGISVDPVTRDLRWFDILNKERLSFDEAGGQTKREPMPEMASAGAAIDATHELVFMQSGLFRRERASGRCDRLAAIEADRPDLRSNDGRTHPSGAFWCSTMSVSKAKGAGSIYWFYRGELRRLYTDLTVGNAICFSEAGDYAHFSDTPAGKIWRVRVDPSNGLPVADPDLFHQAEAGDPSGPDGAVLDRDGCLYSCRWGGGRVDVIDRDGRKLYDILTGGLQTTCAAFFGEGLSKLAITTAREEMSGPDLARYPDSGKTFVVDIGCRGRLDPPVAIG